MRKNLGSMQQKLSFTDSYFERRLKAQMDQEDMPCLIFEQEFDGFGLLQATCQIDAGFVFADLQSLRAIFISPGLRNEQNMLEPGP
jgi:hypothetical protein